MFAVAESRSLRAIPLICRCLISSALQVRPLRPWCVLTLLLAAATIGRAAAQEAATAAPEAATAAEADICVFGGTSAGIVAAVQARRMGKTVLLVEAGAHLGGLTTGGLGATDIGNKAAIGGLAREFYHRIALHYSQPAAWTREHSREYFAQRGSAQAQAADLASTNAAMWTFEPHVAAQVYREMLAEAGITAYCRQRLAAVGKEGARLTEIRMENGNVFRAKMFIDASYEGDLMARAGVASVIGREANAQYGETLNGIRASTPKHQFLVPVDPYVKPGDPASGLLPFIQPGDGGQAGEGDQRIQAYNYRLCFTTVPENRLPVEPPPNYNPADYELLARYIEALVKAGRPPTLSAFWNPIWMPNRKTDINNNGPFSTDFIGMNQAYPEADYTTRERMAREHENYTRGWLTFLAASPRVPESLRQEMRQWGLCKDEFAENGGWPPQLYVREARRMVSDYVMTERHCRGTEVAGDPVGLAAYNMDSHNCQRIARNGQAENEGDVEAGLVKPYPISYRALVPKAGQCANLLVPVCLSASHIAYGSIRMEPVFMVLGQSAATAAALALDQGVGVRQLNYPALRARLLAGRQILDWPPPVNTQDSSPKNQARERGGL